MTSEDDLALVDMVIARLSGLLDELVEKRNEQEAKRAHRKEG
jgi:hypothetical protein